MFFQYRKKPTGNFFDNVEQSTGNDGDLIQAGQSSRMPGDRYLVPVTSYSLKADATLAQADMGQSSTFTPRPR